MRIFTILLLALGCYSDTLFAKNVPFEITPTTTLPLAVTGNQKVVVSYLISNSTKRTLNQNGVVNLPPGITQLTTGVSNACPSYFDLEPGAFCQLILEIDATKLTQPLVDVPTVCNTKDNPTFCSTATIAKQLVTKKVPESEVHYQQIIIMRHAEKPSTPVGSLGQLSCQGLNRALQLPPSLYTQFGKADTMLSVNSAGPDSDYSYVRPLMTTEPTAIQYGKPVLTSLVFTNNILTPSALLSPNFRDSLIYVTWEHKQITPISKHIAIYLGYNPDASNIPSSWPNNDYDTIYNFEVVWYKGIPALSFSIGSEKLDNLSTYCPNTDDNYFTGDPNTQSTPSTPSSTKIYFVQAGPSSDLNPFVPGQLNCRGLNRGLNLITTFRNIRSDYGDVSSYFFASAPPLIQIEDATGEVYYDYLAQQIMEPVAIDEVQPLNTYFGYQDYTPMANHLLSSELQDKVLTVAWDVQTLPSLISTVCEAAGGSEADCSITLEDGKIYVLDFNSGAPAITTIDEEIPSDTCPYPIT